MLKKLLGVEENDFFRPRKTVFEHKNRKNVEHVPAKSISILAMWIQRTQIKSAQLASRNRTDSKRAKIANSRRRLRRCRRRLSDQPKRAAAAATSLFDRAKRAIRKTRNRRKFAFASCAKTRFCGALRVPQNQSRTFRGAFRGVVKEKNPLAELFAVVAMFRAPSGRICRTDKRSSSDQRTSYNLLSPDVR